MRALATDLDGTLLNKKGCISDDTSNYLKQIAGRGFHIILASGRSINEQTCFAPFLPNNFHMVAFNGSMVAEYNDGKYNICNIVNISYPALSAITNALNQAKLPFFVSEGEISHVPTADIANIFRKIDIPSVNHLEDFSVLQNSASILKVAIPLCLSGHDHIERQKDIVAEALSSVNLAELNLQIVNSNEWMDIIPLSGGKSHGVRFVCDKLGISPSDVISFGDGGNDLCMLKLTGKSIAPSNACPAAQSVAQSVSRWSNDDGCVMRELQLLLSKT